MTSGPPLPAELVAAAVPASVRELDEAIMLATAGDNAWPEEAGRFKISTLGQAEWAMRKLAALSQRERAVAVQADEWRDQINWWEEAERKRIAPAGGYFRGLLERWAVEERERTGEKTQRLPSGEVPTRASKPKVVVTDEGALTAWLESQVPSAVYRQVVKVTSSVLVGELRKVVKVAADGAVMFYDADGDGEPVPGVAVEAADVSAHANPSVR